MAQAIDRSKIITMKKDLVIIKKGGATIAVAGPSPIVSKPQAVSAPAAQTPTKVAPQVQATQPKTPPTSPVFQAKPVASKPAQIPTSPKPVAPAPMQSATKPQVLKPNPPVINTPPAKPQNPILNNQPAKPQVAPPVKPEAKPQFTAQTQEPEENEPLFFEIKKSAPMPTQVAKPAPKLEDTQIITDSNSPKAVFSSFAGTPSITPNANPLATALNQPLAIETIKEEVRLEEISKTASAQLKQSDAVKEISSPRPVNQTPKATLQTAPMSQSAPKKSFMEEIEAWAQENNKQ